jgi:hypothetical protein
MAWIFVAVLLVSVASMFIKIPAVSASSTLTFTTSTSDGHTTNHDATYSTVHDAATGTISDTGNYVAVGQLISPYTIYRGSLFFDTSSLPNDAVIDSAILSVYVTDDYSTTDFNVTVQNGQPTYPHDPIVSGDYYYQNYAGAGGTRGTGDGLSEDAYWNITLSATGEGWISLTGYTKLCLRSQEDIDNSAPTANEALQFYSAEAGASYEPKLYVTYTIPDLELTLTSSPEVNAEISVNGTNYVTPSYVSHTSGDTAHLTAEEGVIKSSVGYLFDHWLINGTDTETDISIDLTVTGDTTIAAYYVEIEDLYYFYGPYDEETGYLLDENVTVDIFYDTGGYPVYSYDFNGSWVFPVSPQALYFRFTFEDNSTREYWVDPSEDVLPVYIFKGDTTDYVINFLDTTGILKDYPYVTAKRYVNGTLHTIEKRKVDEYNSVLMSLVYGRTYVITLGSEENTYTFGDLTTTATTGIQLILRGVDFPRGSLIQTDIRMYGVRDNTTITVAYSDASEATVNVTLTFYDSSLTSVYSVTFTNNSFTLVWSSAESDMSYMVMATINHDTYEQQTWKQYFPAVGSAEGFDWSFLGDWGFDSTMIIPAFIIIFAAGCFSKVNAYVGAVLMCVTALILTWIGWIVIPVGLLVAGFALAILMGLVYVKSHGGMGQ